MGCTEPISIAYATAKAKRVLGEEPVSGVLAVSANIVKNAKSVTVPHTGGMKGIKTAFAAGLVGGDPDAELEVLSRIDESQICEIKAVCELFKLDIDVPESCDIFDICVTLYSEKHVASVRIMREHTNVVFISRDGVVLLDNMPKADSYSGDKTELLVKDILEFADTVEISDVEPVLKRQIDYNMAIAEEGLKNDYGANVGRVLLHSYQPDIKITARAYAAAGSDARMNGCDLPVVINSGSGNQGITASVPVIVYARGMNLPTEKLYRALCVSNLITLHLKTGIGTLSAYCGAVSAGVGAGCGIAYLLGGGYRDVAHTLVNALAIDSGILCDGAKASCAAKIAMAVEAGLVGLSMHYNGKQFYAGEGFVKKGVENTIKTVSQIAHKGMSETDREIIRIMLDEDVNA
ncbi:MAG: serine dehydratase subunit alpha family protein [Clostridia bacterium]|nr:serine dehydratase subunit alpha family protein [Clostridia bacterium]